MAPAVHPIGAFAALMNGRDGGSVNAQVASSVSSVSGLVGGSATHFERPTHRKDGWE
jgi:hypothetical protein